MQKHGKYLFLCITASIYSSYFHWDCYQLELGLGLGLNISSHYWPSVKWRHKNMNKTPCLFFYYTSNWSRSRRQPYYTFLFESKQWQLMGIKPQQYVTLSEPSPTVAEWNTYIQISLFQLQIVLQSFKCPQTDTAGTWQMFPATAEAAGNDCVIW